MKSYSICLTSLASVIKYNYFETHSGCYSIIPFYNPVVFPSVRGPYGFTPSPGVNICFDKVLAIMLL
jgi:hypothetical protein